ncbi:hypothetical protein [Amycolatopsis sp. H20-H5]|uniref:hypothetical protein n=1 Tax=Amycolatopsis sp. H20-H5 TaxID=3046309 RepID=UPI002DB6DA17|nr:hypothetical protein [Amycolatopsis sp. H20-H5]MEC3979823.1 hypothetical protein [Amycolatopsis sp. H20-H5]
MALALPAKCGFGRQPQRESGLALAGAAGDEHVVLAVECVPHAPRRRANREPGDRRVRDIDQLFLAVEDWERASLLGRLGFARARDVLTDVDGCERRPTCARQPIREFLGCPDLGVQEGNDLRGQFRKR